MITFWLARAGTVRITVRAVPSCRPVGSFRVAGQAGTNRVRFRGRVRGRLLPPGVYRLEIRRMRRGRPVIVGRFGIEILQAGRDPVARARAPVSALCISTLSFPQPIATADGTQVRDPQKAGIAAGIAGIAKRVVRPLRPPPGFSAAPGAILSSDWVRILALIAVGIAALMFGAAALPRQLVGVPALVERRPQLLTGGFLILIAVALALLIGRV